MTLINPTLTLSFIDEQSSMSVTAHYLIKNSFVFKEQRLNELKSSSNTVNLQLAEDCPAIEYILGTQGDIKAQLKDGNTVLFTGYLSNSYKWTVTDTGTQALSITLEDIGTKLLKKTFLNNSVASEYVFDEYVNQSSSHSVVKQVCDACGITLDTNAPTISVKIVKSIDRDTTCQEILDTMLFEVGYVYYFKPDGRLSLFEINCSSTSGIPTLDSTSLYVVGGTAITLNKKAKQIRQANITWNSLEYRNDVRVYEDISGQSSTYPHCNISIPVGGSYPDTDGNIAKTEAADLEKGSKLVYISDVTPDISVVQGQYTATLNQIGSKAIGVLITNTGISTVEVRKLMATADICAIKAKNVTIQSQTVASDESKNIYSYEAEYIHDTDSAKRLANLIVNYYKYCNYSYTFYSTTNLASGSIVNVVDDTHSGLDVDLLILGKSYNDTSNIIQYTAVSVSPFDLSAAVYTDSTITAPSTIPGEPGLSVATITYYYAATSTNTQPAAADITSTTIPTLDPITNKYLWEKTVITYTDGSTRTDVFLSKVYGDETYTFRLKANPANLIQNRRLTTNQTITLTAEVTGYSGTPTITYYFGDEDPTGSAVTVTATTATISAPYNNSHPSIIAQATLTGAPPQNLQVSAIDETQEYIYFGELEIDTSGYFDVNGEVVPSQYDQVDWTAIENKLGENEQFLEGDSFFNNYSESGFTDVYIYVYQQGQWIPISSSNLSNSIKSEICMKAQKDVLSTIETGSLTKSDFGYFNTIISGTVTADYIGSKEIEVKNGGFIYAGDVDINQPAGQRVAASGAGFCFDSLGNAEVSNIRVTGDSTIEGGSTVLGTLINYDANNTPVFKTVKETNTSITMAGSKTDGTDNPVAYLWSSFTPWLRDYITARATEGTYYSASGSVYGYFGSSIVEKNIIGIRYWASVPTTKTKTEVRGDNGPGNPETKTMYVNNNAYSVKFSEVVMHPKTDTSIWGVTGYGELKVTTYTSGGNEYQILCNQGETEGTSGAGMAYAYNVVVPPGGYIVAEAGTYSGHPWGQWDTDLYINFIYSESDVFYNGINFILPNGSVYAFDSVMPETSAYSIYPQLITCSGLSLSLSMTMSAAASWPVEKYYRFAYSTSPGTSATITTSIFSSQSFSYKGVSKTVASISFNNSFLLVVDTAGQTYEFYTASGNYYPRHSFSFVTLGQSLGAYMRAALPTDDSNTHNIGAAGTYDSGVSQRWNNGFFNSLDVNQGIHANTINSDYVLTIVNTATTIEAMSVGSMKLIKPSGSGITITLNPNNGSYLIIEFKSGNNYSMTTTSGSYVTGSDGLILIIRLS